MNAVIYARYSSYNQTERSIEGQIEDCTAYAERKGYAIVAQYVDRAKSGTEAEHRTDFLRMIKDSEKKQFDIVLVWKMDRFSRNRYDFAVYKTHLKKNGVMVESVNEPVSTDPSGILLDSLIEGMAEYYSQNLSQNVKRGLRVARSRGSFTGGRVPFGYRLTEDRKVVLDEKEAPAMQEAFRKYAAGTRMTEIIDDMNASGLKPRTGSRFTINSFQSAFSNKKYIGIYEFEGEAYTDLFPRLIDDETFAAVQQRKEALKRAPAASKGKHDYLLQGKVFCGHCGSQMVGESGRGKQGNVYHYYTCAARKKAHTCNKKNEKADALESDVILQTVAYLSEPDRCRSIAEGLKKAYEDAFCQSEIQTLENTVNRLKGEIDRCVELIISGSLSAATTKALDEKSVVLRSQLDDAERDLAAMKIQTRRSFSIDEYISFIRDMITGEADDPAFRKRIINLFVNAVYVFDDKLMIYYNVTQQEAIPLEVAKEDASSFAEVSDFNGNAQPNNKKSETFLIKSDLVFGFLAYKNKTGSS